jgi:hypothetical protein
MALLATWPTPCATQLGNTLENYRAMKAIMRSGPRTAITELGMAAQLASWPTPNTPNGGRSVDSSTLSATGMTRDGRKHTVSLEHVVRFAKLPERAAGPLASSWPTPMAGTPSTATYNEAGSTDYERKVDVLLGTRDTINGPKASWRSPAAQNADRGGQNGTERVAAGHTLNLQDQAQLATWATPTTRDHKDGAYQANVPENALLGRQVWQVSGPTPNGSSAPMEKRGQLNPAFSRWLIGLPPVWDDCAVTAMQSYRNSRRRSSPRT